MLFLADFKNLSPEQVVKKNQLASRAVLRYEREIHKLNASADEIEALPDGMEKQAAMRDNRLRHKRAIGMQRMMKFLAHPEWFDVQLSRDLGVMYDGIKKDTERFVALLAPYVKGGSPGNEPATAPAGRAAAMDPAQKGGIDLTRDRVGLQTWNDGNGVQFKFDPAMIQKLQNASGLAPRILGITPMTATVPEFLGIANAADQWRC